MPPWKNRELSPSSSEGSVATHIQPQPQQQIPGFYPNGDAPDISALGGPFNYPKPRVPEHWPEHWKEQYGIAVKVEEEEEREEDKLLQLKCILTW